MSSRQSKYYFRENHTDFFLLVREIINGIDSVGLLGVCPHDEYDPEVEDIISKLNECNTSEEIKEMVIAVFTHWFGSPPSDSDRFENVGIQLMELKGILPLKKVNTPSKLKMQYTYNGTTLGSEDQKSNDESVNEIPVTLYINDKGEEYIKFHFVYEPCNINSEITYMLDGNINDQDTFQDKGLFSISLGEDSIIKFENDIIFQGHLTSFHIQNDDMDHFTFIIYGQFNNWDEAIKYGKMIWEEDNVWIIK
jgi:hypothetical protein